MRRAAIAILGFSPSCRVPCHGLMGCLVGRQVAPESTGPKCTQGAVRRRVRIEHQSCRLQRGVSETVSSNVCSWFFICKMS